MWPVSPSLEGKAPFLTTPVAPRHRPHFGFTRHHGFAVHARTLDHLAPKPDDSAYQRFNKRLALILVKNVGTMTCFWVFWAMGLCILPSVLYAMGDLKHFGPLGFMLTFGFELLGTWLISTCFQAVLLPGLMVGQNLQNEAADARAAKQFEDTEMIADRLDLDTAGGLADVMAAIGQIREQVAALQGGGQ